MSGVSKARALEVMQNTPKDRQYWETEIDKAIKDFYYSNFQAETPEEIAKCSQNSWVACCEYIRRQCVNKEDLTEIREHKINDNCGGICRGEAYSPEKVQVLTDVYLTFCFLYDKAPSVYGFSILSGIDRELMHTWVSGGVVTIASNSNTPKRAVQNIAEARAESLQNSAISGGRGVVGSIAILNNSTWKENNIPAQNERAALSLDQIPRLPVFKLDGTQEFIDLPNLSDYKAT